VAVYLLAGFSVRCAFTSWFLFVWFVWFATAWTFVARIYRAPAPTTHYCTTGWFCCGFTQHAKYLHRLRFAQQHRTARPDMVCWFLLPARSHYTVYPTPFGLRLTFSCYLLPYPTGGLRWRTFLRHGCLCWVPPRLLTRTARSLGRRGHCIADARRTNALTLHVYPAPTPVYATRFARTLRLQFPLRFAVTFTVDLFPVYPHCAHTRVTAPAVAVRYAAYARYASGCGNHLPHFTFSSTHHTHTARLRVYLPVWTHLHYVPLPPACNAGLFLPLVGAPRHITFPLPYGCATRFPAVAFSHTIRPFHTDLCPAVTRLVRR